MKKNKKLKIYRQGDVVIRNDPRPFKGKSVKSITLAEGEVTGHKHLLKGLEEGDVFKMEKLPDGEINFEVVKKSTLEHEEHDAFNLTPDTYYSYIKRSFDYFTKEIERVQD